MAIATLMKAGTEAWRNPGETGAIPGAVSSLTEWVVIGLLVVLFASVLSGIWMVLVHGVPPQGRSACGARIEQLSAVSNKAWDLLTRQETADC
jgi:hypothetical protein